MESRWHDRDAEDTVARYADRDIGRDLALRVYTSRLLGRDPGLVLHGGGNTSVKSRMTDIVGDEVAVLCVKGSGWDLGDIEPAGLPALRLEALQRARALAALTDEDMVSFMRGCLLHASSPNPSVETLLHAFLPHKFVDHTHSTAVLALADQPDGAELCRRVYGNRAALVPYVMPGFDLAKLSAEIQETHPDAEGLILLKHGIFSFGDSARESYERMIDLVTLAERHIEGNRRATFAAAEIPRDVAGPAEVGPILRGALAERNDGDDDPWRRMILEFRASEAILDYVDGVELARYATRGVVTPDHTIRTKNVPLILTPPEAGELERFAAEAKQAIERYGADYVAYFERHDGASGQAKTRLDSVPRVILVPGLGLFGAGKSAGEARVAADLAENNIRVITDAEAIGGYEPAGEADMFELEYWSLEQAKLSKVSERALERHVVLITGGGGGIGAATAQAFAESGATIAILDRDGDRAAEVAAAIGAAAIAIPCDVTDSEAVRHAFDATCAAFGGVDIVVSNAGAAWQGGIGEVPEAVLRESFELNFFAHQSVAQNAVRVLTRQGTGGVLLFNASKQAVNPGPDFGPYGLPKAATLFLSRQYALEYGAIGIRSNAVNADRVNTGLFADGLLEARAAARGLSVDDYLGAGNLLQSEVKASDVARAFVSLATARKTTGAVLTVDGGNIAAALR